MRNPKIYLHVLTVFLVIAVTNLTFAQSTADSRTLPASMLRTMKPRTGESKRLSAKITAMKSSTMLTAASTAGTPGVDSLANWSDQFTAPGFDDNGNPQSVWPFTMVGNPPEAGGTTFINAPIVPVTVELLGPTGTPAFTFSPGADIVGAALGSPMFVPFLYTSGIGQFNDQMMRASFWNRIHRHGDDNGWHTNLVPRLRTRRTMRIPFMTPAGTQAWFVFVDANNKPVLTVIDENVFANLLFPATVPVTADTPIGAAELAGEITTRDMSTFLFNNVALFAGNINNCCILGFHTYDLEPGDRRNGNRERRFVLNFSSWLSPGLFFFGFEDITPWSHELNETFNDPFVNNATPWWLSVDPFTGSGLCQNNLETGDVVEVLTSVPVYQVAINGRTYHPQNEAMFPWFAFQSPSTARMGAYSFPDETTLTALSPAPLLPGCVAP